MAAMIPALGQTRQAEGRAYTEAEPPIPVPGPLLPGESDHETLEEAREPAVLKQPG
jgi:hypothetical protein